MAVDAVVLSILRLSLLRLLPLQAVPNMDADAYLPPIQPQTQQPLTVKLLPVS